jgi:peptidoglycan/LPS O-acetylase OafA/YrhL
VPGERHAPTLDGVRFFAFALVFLHHAYDASEWNDVLPVKFGQHGVQIFFVLSGFLIGRILIGLRERSDLGLGHRAGLFYARRALRIFPLYYLILSLVSIHRALHLGILTQPRWMIAPGWHSLYLTNIVMVVRRMGAGTEGHLWSLCVEEHFYLLAPMFIIGTSRPILSRILMIAAIINTAVRGWSAWVADPESTLYFFSPLHFDTIGMGIVAAIVEKDGAFLGISRARLMRVAKIAGLAIVPLLLPSYIEHPKFVDLVQSTCLPLCRDVATAGLLLALWQNTAPRTCAFFAFRPFAYLGKISYGLYLYHLYCLDIALHFAPKGSHLHAAIAIGMTVAIAMVSWHVFEKPINDLKNRLQYPERRVPASFEAMPMSAEG